MKLGGLRCESEPTAMIKKPGGRMPSDFSVHSDLLVHWSGKDIDEEHQPNWVNEDQSDITDETVDAYVRRLRDILKFGLWMTEQPSWITPNKTRVPSMACLCFTELKLSQSRAHARRYGRLGIAVKRPFVFKRGGRPVVYFEPRFGEDVMVTQLSGIEEGRKLLHFFRPMDSGTEKRLQYDIYSESEWRIVEHTGHRWEKYVIDPRGKADSDVKSYFNSLSDREKKKLRYLVPLDGWHAGIVYPGLKIKNEAQRKGSEIRGLIREIATRGGASSVEGENLPIELDLDLCRNL